jgi:hypothetical protein
MINRFVISVWKEMPKTDFLLVSQGEERTNSMFYQSKKSSRNILLSVSGGKRRQIDFLSV